MDFDRTQPPAVWVDDLASSDADIAHGDVVTASDVHALLDAALAKLVPLPASLPDAYD